MLDEASNASTYADATGRGNTLVRGANAIVQTTGPLGGTDKAARFGSAGASSLTLDPPTADVSPGNQAHFISGWALLDSLGTTQQAFWGQANTAAIKFGNVLYYYAGTDRLQSDFANNVDIFRNAVVVGDSLGSPGTGVWHHMLFEYDPVSNVETLYIDGMANVLAEVQRPAPRTGPNRAHFSVPPSFNPHSGWDSVGSQCFASRAANADLAFVAGTSKSLKGWIRFDDHATAQSIMGDLSIVGASVNMSVVLQQSANHLYFLTGNQAGLYDQCSVVLADGAWHAFVCWYDAGSGTININLDNGAATASVSVTHPPAGPLGDFQLGGSRQSTTASGFGLQMLGDVGAAGVALGVPTANDIASLWAYGSGRFY